MAWWEVDFNYWGIQLLALLGLAKNIKVMRPRLALSNPRNPLA
jgi:fatty-acid desaturase